MAYVPQFGGVLWTLLAFIIALSVIVAIHEYGHYIVGRLSGIHAEVFSLGFGPVLFARTDRHGTRWQFALLPFGGYVKFLGDSDAASAGKDETAIATMNDVELRRTIVGAPLWARALTVAAGPVFNFALSIIVFTGVLLVRGDIAEPLTVGALRPMPAEVQQLEVGDEILAIGGVEMPGYDAVQEGMSFREAVPLEPLLDYRVSRAGEEITVQAPYPYPAMVGQLAPQSAAYDIEMAVGDVIVGVDGDPIFAFDQLKERVESSNGKVLLLDVWRAGEMLEFALAPRRVDEPQSDGGFVTNWRIGIVGGLFFEPATETPSFGAALMAGLGQTWAIIKGSISGLYHMITGAISSCNMSGPLGIAQVSGQMASQGAESFVWFIGVLSTAVGLLNLFPIPILDGGHLVFYAYEAVTGKPPNDKVLRVLMAIGLALILSLMLFALKNDIFCP